MKKTRKVPIILTGLILLATGLGGNLPVRALNGASQDIMAAAREAAEEFSIKTNATGAYLKLNTIDYKTGMANGAVSVPEGNDWYIKKIVVAYMNFARGVSEEEADQNLAGLRGYKDDNWNIVSLYENYAPVTKKEQNIILNKAQTGRDITANKSDTLYYAVELGEMVDGKWANTWWSRGKIDYRSCVHSKVFDKETMSCALVEDGEEIKYLPQINETDTLVDVPEGEKVISWREEWKDVILLEYEAVQDEMEVMWGYLTDGLWVLDQNDLALDGILESVKHYEAGDSKLYWLPQSSNFLKERIVELRKFYEKDDGTDTDKLEALEKENESLKQTKITLEGEKTVLTQEKVALGQENEELKAGKTALEQENAGLKAEKVVLGQENEKIKSEKSALEQEILRLKAENEALRASKDGLEEDLAQGEDAAKSEIKGLNQEIERMAAEVAELKQNAVELGQNAVKLRQDAARLETEKAEISTRNAELEQKLSGTVGKYAELERKWKEIVSKNEELEQNIVKIEAEKRELEKRVAEMKEAMEKTEAMTVTEDTQGTQGVQSKQEVIEGQKCEVVNVANEAKTDVKTNAKTEETSEAVDGQNIEATKEEVPAEGVSRDDEEVVVPNLGDEETKANRVWWLIPVAGVLGAVIVFVKRKFARR